MPPVLRPAGTLFACLTGCLWTARHGAAALVRARLLHRSGVLFALAGLVTTFLTGGARRHNAIGMKGRLRSGLELAALHNILAVDIDHLTLLVCFILWGRAVCVCRRCCAACTMCQAT